MSLNEQIDSLEQVVSRIRTELNKKKGELSEVVSQLKPYYKGLNPVQIINTINIILNGK